MLDIISVRPRLATGAMFWVETQPHKLLFVGSIPTVATRAWSKRQIRQIVILKSACRTIGVTNQN